MCTIRVTKNFLCFVLHLIVRPFKIEKKIIRLDPVPGSASNKEKLHFTSIQNKIVRKYMKKTKNNAMIKSAIKIK